MAAGGDTVFGILHTPDGAPLYWDAASGGVRHAAQPDSPRNLACLTNGRDARLIVFDPASGGVVGTLAAGPGGTLCLAVSDAALWNVEEQAGFVALRDPVGRLVWRADGTAGMGAADAETNGWFLAVSSLTRACLASIDTDEWIQTNGTKVARAAGGGAEPALRLGGEVVRLGGVPGPFVVADDPPGSGALRQLYATGAKGRLHRLALFRPVICFAVFGEDAYYDALGLALQALHRFGGYAGAVCIGSDRPRETTAAYVPAAYRDSWRHVAVPAEAGLFARYGLAGWGLEAFQPVLYLDVDVVANAAVRPLLTQLAVSPKVHLATEQALEANFAGSTSADLAKSHDAAWFGGWLFAADPRFRGRLPAFGSSGAIGADHVTRLSVPFELVQSLRRVVEPARIDTYTDQALANYALHVCNAGFGLMNGFLDFARSAEEAGEQRRGLMHFHSGVGHGQVKRDAMARYIERLAAMQPRIGASG